MESTESYSAAQIVQMYFKDFEVNYDNYFLRTLQLKNVSSSNLYVEQCGVDLTTKEEIPMLTTTFFTRLTSEQDLVKCFVILSDSGLGKTSLGLELVRKLWKRCLEDQFDFTQVIDGIRLPVYIYITSLMTREDVLNIVTPFTKFAQVVFVFDGYEQCSQDVKDYIETELNFDPHDFKFILLCRNVSTVTFDNLSAHYASDRQDRLLMISLQKFSKEQILEFTQKFVDVIYLAKPGDALFKCQTIIFESGACKPSSVLADEWLNSFLFKSRDIAELSKIPIFLSVLVQILPSLLKKDERNVTSDGPLDYDKMCLSKGEIFDHFVDQWLEFQIDRWKFGNGQRFPDLLHLHSRNLLKKYIFAYTQNLAETLIDRESGIMYDDPIPVSKTLGKDMAEPYCEKELLEHYVTCDSFPKSKSLVSQNPNSLNNLGVLRDCSLLVATGGQKSYSFLHRSFAEYFISRNIFIGLKSQFELRTESAAGNLKYNLIYSNSPRLVDQSLLQLLADRVAKSPEFKELFFSIIMSSKKEHTLTNLAANCITILNMADASFEGLDFSDIQIPNAILIGAKCANVNFQKANLGNVDFSQAWLAGAFFEGSNLNGATFGQIDISTPDVNTDLVVWKDEGGNISFLVACQDVRVYFYRRSLSTQQLEMYKVLRHSKRKRGFLRLSVCGNILLTCLGGEIIKFWELPKGNYLGRLRICDTSFRGLIRTRSKFSVWEIDGVEQPTFSTSGKVLVENSKQTKRKEVLDSFHEITCDSVGNYFAVSAYHTFDKILVYSLRIPLVNKSPILISEIYLPDSFLGMQINSAGTIIVVASNKRIHIRNLGNPADISQIVVETDWVPPGYYFVRFSPCDTMFSCSLERRTKMWKSDNGVWLVLATLDVGEREVIVDTTFGSDEKSFIVVTNDEYFSGATIGSHIRVYKLPTLNLSRIINPSVEIGSIISGYSGEFATISQDFRSNNVRKKLLQIWSTLGGERETEEINEPGLRLNKHSLISSQGDWIASVHSESEGNGTCIKFWDSVTGLQFQMVSCGDIGNVICLANIQNGNILVVGDRGEMLDGESQPHDNIKILSSLPKWHVVSGQRLAMRESNDSPYFEQDKSTYTYDILDSIAVNREGSMLALGSYHGINIQVKRIHVDLKGSLTFSSTIECVSSLEFTGEDARLNYTCVNLIKFGSTQSATIFASTWLGLLGWNLVDGSLIFEISREKPRDFSVLDILGIGNFIVGHLNKVYTTTDGSMNVWSSSNINLYSCSTIQLSHKVFASRRIISLAYEARYGLVFVAVDDENEVFIFKDDSSEHCPMEKLEIRPNIKLWSNILYLNVSAADPESVIILVADINEKLTLLRMNPYTLTWSLVWSKSPSLRLLARDAHINEIVSANVNVINLFENEGAQGTPASRLQNYIRSHAFVLTLLGTGLITAEPSIFSMLGSHEPSVFVSDSSWAISAVARSRRSIDPTRHIALVIEGVSQNRKFFIRADLIAESDTKRVAIRVRPFHNAKELEDYVNTISECRTWNISREDGANIIEAIRANQLQPIEYNFFTGNCVNWSIETLRAGGIHVQQSRRNELFTLPSDIFKNQCVRIVRPHD